MYELFCNKCVQRNRPDTTLQFYFSPCEHVLCKSCLDRICPVCGKQYKPTMICKDMPMNMATYFGDSLQLVRSFQRVIKFQVEQDAQRFKYHYQILPTLSKKLNREQSALIKVEQQIRNALDGENKRIAKLKKYLAYHERRLDQVPGGISLSRSQPFLSKESKRQAAGASATPAVSRRGLVTSPWGHVSTPTLSVPDSSDD